MFNEATSYDRRIASWRLGDPTILTRMLMNASNYHFALCSWDFSWSSDNTNMLLGTDCDYTVDPERVYDVPFACDECNLLLETLFPTEEYDADITSFPSVSASPSETLSFSPSIIESASPSLAPSLSPNYSILVNETVTDISVAFSNVGELSP